MKKFLNCLIFTLLIMCVAFSFVGCNAKEEVLIPSKIYVKVYGGDTEKIGTLKLVLSAVETMIDAKGFDITCDDIKTITNEIAANSTEIKTDIENSVITIKVGSSDKIYLHKEIVV